MPKPSKSSTPAGSPIKTITGVNSVETYLRAVDQIYRKICPPGQPLSCELWFRGVKSSTFNLDPSITRGLGAQAEIVYLSKFDPWLTLISGRCLIFRSPKTGTPTGAGCS